MAHEKLSTHQRAVELNLDHSAYGTLAEIGAGQEVSRWLFRVGGAAGTVAKSFSAYDMTVSDQVYGKSGRYVSRQRVLSMLDHEYQLLQERLGSLPDNARRLFAFADTVSARNYQGTNECHGWMGVRFQYEPGGPPHDILLHLNMLDPTNLLQQEAVGILGINLIYAAYYESASVAHLTEALGNELGAGRMEVDTVHLEGRNFGKVDAAMVGLHLVRHGLAQAVLFSGGELRPPTEVVRKRSVVLKRGLFQETAEDIAKRITSGQQCLVREFGQFEREPLAALELSTNPAGGGSPAPDAVYLSRLRELCALDNPVLLTRLAENYELTAYLRRYSQEPLRFVLGASNLAMILVQEFYAELTGGVVEGIGKLFADNVKIYILPMRRDAFYEHLQRAGVDASFVTVESDVAEAATLHFKKPLGHLYSYLIEMKWLVTISGETPDPLHFKTPPAALP